MTEASASAGALTLAIAAAAGIVSQSIARTLHFPGIVSVSYTHLTLPTIYSV